MTQLWISRVWKFRIMEQKCNDSMIAVCSRQVWWSLVQAPLKKLCQFWPIP